MGVVREPERNDTLAGGSEMIRCILLVVLGIMAAIAMFTDKERGVQWLCIVLIIAHMMESAK